MLLHGLEGYGLLVLRQGKVCGVAVSGGDVKGWAVSHTACYSALEMLAAYLTDMRQ